MFLPNADRFPKPLAIACILMILLGLVFRVATLDRSVFWVDEVATAIRISGYTKAEVIEQLCEKQTLTLTDLQHYQQPNPERDWKHTLAALRRSPEHAPLYFLLARAWSLGFGSSVATLRSLSLLLSLLSLPCLFALAYELFASTATAWLAVALFSLSPFLVAYAQEARPYSLWTLTLLLSSLCLLRAMRLNRAVDWSGYSLCVMLSLYTSLLSLPVLLGHAFYLLGQQWGQSSQRTRRFLLAMAVALVAFAPWLVVMLLQWANLQDNTTWMRSPLHPAAMAVIWVYSLAVLFFDVPVGPDPLPLVLAKAAMASLVLGVMGAALWKLRAKTPARIWLFIWTFSLTAPFSLVLLDLGIQGQLSTAPRYFMPCHLGLLLAIAYLFTAPLQAIALKPPSAWKPIPLLLLVVLIGSSLFSCVIQLDRPSKYQKSRNLHNLPIAALLNQASAPLLIAEPSQVMDLLSLSHQLEPKVQTKLLAANQLPIVDQSCRELFLFNPSTSLQNQIRASRQFKLTEIYRPDRLISSELAISLWRLTPVGDRCTASRADPSGVGQPQQQ